MGGLSSSYFIDPAQDSLLSVGHRTSRPGLGRRRASAGRRARSGDHCRSSDVSKLKYRKYRRYLARYRYRVSLGIAIEYRTGTSLTIL